MAKPELGTKRICVSCAARFYDLTRQPAVCPKCDTEQPAEQPRIRRPIGNLMDEKRRPKAAVAPGREDADADAEVEVAEDDADEDVLEDTNDLEDEAEAIVEVEVESNDEER